MDTYSARLAAAVHASHERLDVFLRAGGDDGWTTDRVRTRESGWRIILYQRYGLRARAPGDYDRWAASGLADWSYADVLPYFRRQESWEGGANDLSGFEGPLRTQFNRYPTHSRRVPRSRPQYGPSVYPGLQWGAAGGLRPLAVDGSKRPALQHSCGLPSAGTGKAQSQARSQSACHPHTFRGHACCRYRVGSRGHREDRLCCP